MSILGARCMNSNLYCREKPIRSRKRHGLSSFRNHDSGVVFQKLALEPGDRFLDLGCGPGDYSLHAAQIVGEHGTVYAMDSSERMAASLKAEAKKAGAKNILAVVCDIASPLPLTDRLVDCCLVSMVLHIPGVYRNMAAMLEEIRRVLKPSGRLAIVECKTEDMPCGPPARMRLSPDEIENSLNPHGFRKLEVVDLGLNFLILFAAEALP